MDTHDEDPRGEDPSDPWQQATEQFSSLGSTLRERYTEIVGDDGPAEDDVRDAIKTIGTAAQSMFESISASMRDPAVRDQVKEASATFFSAIGRTLGELGDELRKPEPPPRAPEPPEGEPGADQPSDA